MKQNIFITIGLLGMLTFSLSPIRTSAVVGSPGLGGGYIAEFSGQLINLKCAEAANASGDPHILTKSNIQITEKTSYLDSKQVELIRGVINRAEQLGIGDKLNGIEVQVMNRRPTNTPCASFTAGAKTIQLISGCTNGDKSVSGMGTVKHFAHELGHTIGLGGFYGSYFSAVKPECGITKYCTKNHNKSKRNEEFAEVTALYMLAPDRLRAHCPEAYAFMKNNVFKGPEPTNDCAGLGNGGIGGDNGEGEYAEATSQVRPTSMFGSSSNGGASVQAGVLTGIMNFQSQQQDSSPKTEKRKENHVVYPPPGQQDPDAILENVPPDGTPSGVDQNDPVAPPQ